MSSEFISIIILGALYVYQSYCFWKLEKLVFTQFTKIWNFQHDVINAIDRLRIVKVEYLTKLSNNENKNEDDTKA